HASGISQPADCLGGVDPEVAGYGGVAGGTAGEGEGFAGGPVQGLAGDQADTGGGGQGQQGVGGVGDSVRARGGAAFGRGGDGGVEAGAVDGAAGAGGERLQRRGRRPDREVGACDGGVRLRQRRDLAQQGVDREVVAGGFVGAGRPGADPHAAGAADRAPLVGAQFEAF